MAQQTTPFPDIKDVPISAWEKLAQKKIYFGHQSVGYNIIDGIRDVMKENPQIKLNIVETSNPADFNSGIFAHSKIGRNMEPVSKIDEFVTFMQQGLGNKTDITALKFCYVDIMDNSNVEDIFSNYESSMSRLKKLYPEMTIIHFTTPLTKVQTGPKAWIKKIIGKPVIGIDDNIKKNEYNEILLKRYKDKEPVFDIAAIESTFQNGARSSFIKAGKTYYSIVPECSDDMGHLNEKGRKIVAEQLLIFLTKI